MPLTAAEIAKQIDGEVLGDRSVELSGFAPADKARAGDLTFAENQTYFNRAEQSAAAAIMVDGEFTSTKKTLIRVPNARVAFAKVLPLFFPEPTFAPGIHPSAVVAPSAQVDPAAHIGPHCVIGEQVRIGARCVLLGGNHIGAHCVIGADTQLFPNAVLYPRTQVGQRVRIHAGAVIGSDGFGYVLDSGAHRKVPQIGHIIIHDDVEIGANTTIDRGALGPTSIGRGTKIDNLVQIAHNVALGEHCLVVAQAGIAGSTKLGNFVTLAGQVGLAGHLKIGNKVTVAAQSGVMHDIPDGEKWFGYPAQPDRQTKRQMLAIQQLPDLVRRVAELEKKLK
ncbi:MAG TPA: UDP-3-O-(3-hydroxymyristoyl)glucosamine N-acyltransferase [Haliangiales bacterium]|nr:UDP-3-O-(3-hydroxymyristoyl)glucosamine N-acyltransferase [Haliangiales bacterium]